MKPLKLCILFLLISVRIIPQAEDSMVVGTYLNSSPNISFTQQNFYIVKPVGFNTIIQRAVIQSNGNNTSNLDSLSQFPNIIAGNDSTHLNVVNPNNADWIYFFSNALYSKWTPENNSIPQLADNIGVKKGFGYEIDGCLTTGTDTSDTGKLFVNGPNHAQYQRYVYTNKYNPNNLVNYVVNFRLKRGATIGLGSPVCLLQVISVNPSDTLILNSAIVTAQMLENEFKSFKLNYNYGRVFNKPLGRGDMLLPPTTIPPKQDVTDVYFDINTKVQFRIIWLGNVELMLDCIEVYDTDIWEQYFIRNTHLRDALLANYLAGLNCSIDYPVNMRAYYGMEHPDRELPATILQSLLRSQGSAVRFLTNK